MPWSSPWWEEQSAVETASGVCCRSAETTKRSHCAEKQIHTLWSHHKDEEQDDQESRQHLHLLSAWFLPLRIPPLSGAGAPRSNTPGRCRARLQYEVPFQCPQAEQQYLVKGFPSLVEVLQSVNVKNFPIIETAEIQDDAALVLKGVDMMEKAEGLAMILQG